MEHFKYILIAWHPGFYKAIKINHLNSGKPGDKIGVELLANSEGLCTVKWPEKTRHLEFIKGPNELGLLIKVSCTAVNNYVMAGQI